jgi:hypothetical protein
MADRADNSRVRRDCRAAVPDRPPGPAVAGRSHGAAGRSPRPQACARPGRRERSISTTRFTGVICWSTEDRSSVVEHPGSIRACEDRRARAESPDEEAAFPRLSDQHHARSLRAVAPYQPDWSRMLVPEAFATADVERALAAVPDLTNLRPSHVHAMAYEFETIAGYLRRHPRDSMVLIAIGDHQPPAAVSGRDVSWSVPVHVFGRRGPIFRSSRRPRLPIRARAASSADWPDALAHADVPRGVQRGPQLLTDSAGRVLPCRPATSASACAVTTRRELKPRSTRA